MKNFRNYFKREKRRILPLCLDIRPEGKDGRWGGRFRGQIRDRFVIE